MRLFILILVLLLAKETSSQNLVYVDLTFPADDPASSAFTTPAILTFLNDFSFELTPGIPFGLFYMILARSGTQTTPHLFLNPANGIMMTNVQKKSLFSNK